MVVGVGVWRGVLVGLVKGGKRVLQTRNYVGCETLYYV